MMMRVVRLAVLAGAALAVAAPPAAQGEVYRDGPVYARVEATSVELGNSQASRRWTRTPFRTEALVDRRGADRTWSSGSRDFALSIGELEDCVVQCPLHEGRFDLCSGETVQMPTTGGLDADGVYHPTWSPAGKDAKVDPPGKKAEARRLTRVRRLRYYPVRIVEGRVEVAVPPTVAASD